MFTASNGAQVVLTNAGATGYVLADGDDSVASSYLGFEQMKAWREFARAEEDTRLGRWRWPENPNITVRIAPTHAQSSRGEGPTVMIQQDSDGYVGYYTRDRLPEITDKTGGIVRAGHAYFEAHPEPKPWHDAKEDEVWLITYNGSEFPSIFQAGRFRDHGGSWDADSITTARRIWPHTSEELS